MTLYYAGIGSRETNSTMKEMMMQVASIMAQNGFTLRSGHAQGADIAFEKGCILAEGKMEIYLPWKGFNQASTLDARYIVPKFTQQYVDLMEQFHPNPDKLTDAGRKLMMRNGAQLLGAGLNSPSSLVICWTKDGKDSGGTGQAIRMANHYNIPVVNMFDNDWSDQLEKVVNGILGTNDAEQEEVETIEEVTQEEIELPWEEPLPKRFSWARKGGYECSSKGDKRFSALIARMPDGRTIEEHYQVDVKGYKSIADGKGKAPLIQYDDLFEEYLNLWIQWSYNNIVSLEELKVKAIEHDYILSDMFANTNVNQARALSTILNMFDTIKENAEWHRDMTIEPQHFEVSNLKNIRILNKHKDTWDQEEAEHITRGNPLGNPFSWEENSTAEVLVNSREEAISEYEAMLTGKLIAKVDDPMTRRFYELCNEYHSGMQVDLVCCCAPKACHGEVIKKLILIHTEYRED